MKVVLKSCEDRSVLSLNDYLFFFLLIVWDLKTYLVIFFFYSMLALDGVFQFFSLLNFTE